ncbi:MAG TPA: hypothetical protein VK504_31595, partial [Vicinamibacterales bacterium]|nr:hypothetical protein [Vicinamibacterales bacterium]
MTATLTQFQEAAIARIEEVFRATDIVAEPFHVKDGAEPTAWSSFSIDGKEHVLAIFPKELNIREGPNLYECYLPSEFATPSTLIESFATRLHGL